MVRKFIQSKWVPGGCSVGSSVVVVRRVVEIRVIYGRELMLMNARVYVVGMTRSKRYANHKGGRKYAPHQAGGGGEVDIRGEELAKWEPATEKERKARAEKLEASEIFKGVLEEMFGG